MLRPLALSLLVGGLALVSRTPVQMSTPVQTATLKGGVARVEITPQIGLPMYGYRNRSGPSLGVIFHNRWLDRLREAVRKSTRVSYVLVVASHTHSGPAPQGDCPSRPVPAWETAALDKI